MHNAPVTAIGLTAAFAASSALLFVDPAQAGVSPRINEIRIDQPGGDVDEYVEIAAAPGSVLSNVFYIVIGDQSGAIPPLQNGTIETVINLSGSVVPLDGVLLVAKSTYTLGVPDLVATFNFEELDNVTHLLVSGFSGSNGQDLDTNNDGVLDVTPWTGILDSVALVLNPTPNGTSADFFYSSTVVGPDGAFSPSQVWRCSDTLDWNIGEFTIGGTDSPGSPNPECSEGPEVTINEVRIEQTGTDSDEYFELRGPANSSLDGLAYVVIGDPADGATNTNSGVIEAVVTLDATTIPADGIFLVAEDDNTLGAIADLFAELNFEGSDNVTHLLVQGFTGLVGDDLDTNDDGVLDTLPWATIVDSLAFVETTAVPPAAGSEYVYSETLVGPEGSFVPGHAYICVPDGNWLIGPFDPTNGVDTPGASNSECTSCGIPGSGGCFAEHGPGCDDGDCCNTVCAVDSTCCDVAWDADCVASATALCLAGGTPPAVLISEIRVDQTGTDNDEHFELSGVPGTPLDGVTYLVIGDGSGATGSGVIESVTPLDGQLVPASGFFVCAEASFTLGTANFIANLNFENSDTVTHLLVYNFTGANNDDLDVDNDGVLDVTPWALVIDGIVLKDDANPPASGAEFGYFGAVAGPDGTFPPSQVYRCTPDGTWSVGEFDTVTPDSPGAPNADCGAVVICGNPGSADCFTEQLTPGCSDGGCCEQVCAVDATCCEAAWDAECVAQANTLCLTGGKAPAVTISEIRIDQPGTDNDEYFELAAAGSTSLNGVFYIVIGDGAGAAGSGVIEAVIDLGGQAITSGFFVAAESTFTLGVADLVLGANGLNFENGDNVTHMLVFNFTGANGQDLDADDDGVLDVTPWTTLIDSVALVGPNFPPMGAGQEQVYSETIVGPDVNEGGSFVPGHVFVCDDGWLIGPFDPTAGLDTPGSANDCPRPEDCPEDFNDDGVVDGADLGTLLSQWGVAGSADLNGDGIVDGADLGSVLAAWGGCDLY